jgi:methylenetetrahydrofolate reductase (NADPH)
MSLQQLYKNKSPLSFEIFPPKTDNGKIQLFNELQVLSKYNPAFISVTYGAGGSTRNKTFDYALEIKKSLKIEPVIHFTCVSHSRTEIKNYLDKMKNNNINNILALRGDPPKGEEKFTAPIDGFSYANQLVEFISTLGNFNIAVAGYPEGHIEAKDFKTDLTNLKKKVDAGAEIIITQLFFDNNDFFIFSDELLKMDINIPVIPGIIPVTGINQIEKISNLCGAKIPDKLISQLSKYKDEKDIYNAGIEYSIRQCEELKIWGVPAFHFYTLNKSDACVKIIDALNLNKK